MPPDCHVDCPGPARATTGGLVLVPGRAAHLALAVAVAAAALAGCDSQRETADSATITVWDYYGSSTPIKPAIAAFETAHPGITVRHVEKEYDDVLASFGADSARGAGPSACFGPDGTGDRKRRTRLHAAWRDTLWAPQNADPPFGVPGSDRRPRIFRQGADKGLNGPDGGVP